MKPMTIKELHDKLHELIGYGYGKRIVMVSDDEECNGFHPLYGEWGEAEEKTWLEEYQEVRYIDERNEMKTSKTILIS